jgi:carbamoyl-phosphate synthase large subunit
MRSNVLITSAGRRGVLVTLFQRELRLLFPQGKVFGGDLNPSLSSACHLADGSFTLPPVTSSAYVAEVLNICLRHDIGLVVPTIDTELMALAEQRDMLQEYEISVIVSDASLVRRCRDKRLTNDVFRELGIEFPRVVERPRAADLPLFAKPFDGSCSVGTHMLRTADEMAAEILQDEKLVFVEYLDPREYEEYTVDLYYDRTWQLKCLIPRLRIETRGGEVSKGRTTRLSEHRLLCNAFEKLTGARGCITAQLFRHRDSGRIVAIEINPRFGGGFPLSYEAGANYPRFLLEEYLLNRTIEFHDDWESNLTMLRYDGQVFVRGTAA